MFCLTNTAIQTCTLNLFFTWNEPQAEHFIQYNLKSQVLTEYPS